MCAILLTAAALHATASAEPVKTGKERLSEKASDEQRVDNCKVPPARWGKTPRPSSCARDSRENVTH